MGAEFLSESVGLGADFVGDLLLDMAVTGLLVLEPDHADLLIDEMTEALDVVCTWRRVNELLRNPDSGLTELGLIDEQTTIDAVFAEQMAPGRLDQAMTELPKYIQAFTIVRDAARG